MNYKIYDQLPQEAKEIRIKVFMEEQSQMCLEELQLLKNIEEKK